MRTTGSKLSLFPFLLVGWPSRRAAAAAFVLALPPWHALVSTTTTARYRPANPRFLAVPSTTSTTSTIQNSARRRSLCCCAAAKPKRAGSSIVDSYQTVSVNCRTCGVRLFRYKKKNGTKSNLVKCYVERIVDDDCEALLVSLASSSTSNETAGSIPTTEYACPSCQTRFARAATIRGLPALKLVGGKTRMTKK